jgi:hypothetical protein
MYAYTFSEDGEVTVTELLRYLTSLIFKVTSNGFLTFTTAIACNRNETVTLKLGNGFHITRYISTERYIVTFFNNRKILASCLISRLGDICYSLI